MLGIYCRVSKDRKNQKSIKEQRLQGEEFAKCNGLKYQFYIDTGISGGGDTEKRFEYTKLLEDIKNDIVTSVYISAQDRLEREEVTWFAFANLVVEKEITLYEDGNLIELDNEGVFFSRGVISQSNALYRRLIGKKIKQVIHRNLSEGKVHGPIPFGYTRDEHNNLIVKKEDAEIVRYIYDLSLNGEGCSSIAEMLNNKNIKTKYNSKEGFLTTINKNSNSLKKTIKPMEAIKWTNSTILNIIKNEIYKGVRKFGKQTYTAPPVVTPDYWNKVVAHLQDNRMYSGVKIEHKYLLKGFLTCGKCNSNMYGRTRADLKDNFYQCSSKRSASLNCGTRSINIKVLDSLVWFYLINNEVKKVKEYIENNSDKSVIEKLKKQIASLEKELKEIAKTKLNILKAVEQGYFNDELNKRNISLMNKEQDVKLRLNNLHNQLQTIEQYNSSENKIDFYTTDFNTRKEIIKLLIYDIKISYIDKHYYVKIYPSLKTIQQDTIYIEYVLSTSYKYIKTNIGDISGKWNSVVYYNYQLTQFKNLKHLKN
jgi:site-specific DNA recombinase